MANSKPQVLVCQHGARHRYAVPRILEESGMLAALYTDSSEFSCLGTIAKLLGELAPKRIRRLANRRIVSIPRKKIFSSDVLVYSNLCRLGKHSEYDQWCRILSSKMKAFLEESSSFDVVYNMFCENLEFLQHIRNYYSAKIISDIYVHPYAGRLVEQERLALNMDFLPHKGIQSIDIKHVIKACELSDALLCPSQFVADGVVQLNKMFAEKVVICPYGTSIQYDEKVSTPRRGRVFWAGGDWIRKGLHVLASAANELLKIYPEMEFRIAGIDNEDVANMPIFKSLNFLGKLDKEQMQKEYLLADCFVLPSIAEGMAGVAIEASAAGCPVIVTRCVGIDGILDGDNGFIIEVGDARRLAECIERLFMNRDLRKKLSLGAKELASKYTEEAWSKRLSQVLFDLKGMHNG